MAENILILAAHPDDETLGCGATLARLSSEGQHIKLITFTDGIGSRGSGGDRRPQVEESARILGIDEFVCGNFPDNMMDSVSLLSICQFVEQNVDGCPDIIFTHHPECLNVDHRIVYQATLTVFRPQLGNSHDIYSYSIPSSTDYNSIKFAYSYVYFDVKDFVSTKMQALKVYDEEMRKYPHSRSYDNILNLMKVHGSEVGLDFAEKFCHVRSVL